MYEIQSQINQIENMTCVGLSTNSPECHIDGFFLVYIQSEIIFDNEHENFECLNQSSISFDEYGLMHLYSKI